MNGQTIILLDDDVELRTFFATTLESAGFAVVAASNSKHVVELVAEHRAVLLVSDLVMPDHEGIEGIFSVLRTFHIPIIAISSYREYLNIVEPVVKATLLKPITGSALLDAVKKVLRLPKTTCVPQ